MTMDQTSRVTVHSTLSVTRKLTAANMFDNALTITSDLSYVICQVGRTTTYFDNAINGANTYTDAY